MMDRKAKDTIRIEKPFLSAVKGNAANHIPFWFMRQAGRYLPEYRDCRKTAGGFLDMVYNPDFACEVTMQPLRRYGMSAAILFSDILVIPHALGQNLEFVAGEGPKLEPVENIQALGELSFDESILAPVYESVRSIRAQMDREGFDDTALIGFAGAPWTVATYMVEGGGSKTFERVKNWAYGAPDEFAMLIDLICDASIRYLGEQIEAGAEAVQIFDSWAGALDERQFYRWVIEPTCKITKALKEKYPDVPIIGFPKGAGVMYQVYADDSGVDTLGLDSQVPLEFAAALQKQIPVQGNLDPVYLLAGGDTMIEATKHILDTLSGGPFVFNLGHGIIKETPPDHVAVLSDFIRTYKP